MLNAPLPPHVAAQLHHHPSWRYDANLHCRCRFQPRSQPALRRRRQLIQRLLLVGSLFCTAVFFFFPNLRPNLGAGPLSYLSTNEDSQLETVRYYDLSNVQGTARGWEREERILLCAPLRDAAPHLDMFFGHLKNLTYPHNLIDLAFLVGDSKDNTIAKLNEKLLELQANPDLKQTFGEISIMEKDFGQKVNQDVESRHGFAAQGFMHAHDGAELPGQGTSVIAGGAERQHPSGRPSRVTQRGKAPLHAPEKRARKQDPRTSRWMALLDDLT